MMLLRSMSSLCWIVPVLALGACTGTTEVSQTSPFGAAPSFSGPYPHPMSDMAATTEADKKARIHTELGMEYFDFGRPKVALDEARIALEAKSGYPPAYHLMGLAYMGLQQDGQADEAFRQALSAAPGDPEFNNSYGWFLCNRMKRVAEAMSRFATSAANPYYCCKTRPHTNAGLCLMENKDYARAEVQFAKALEADASNAVAMYQLADVGYRQGNHRRAYDLLIQYHRRFNPNPSSVWLGLRAARRLGERHSEASYAEQLRSRFAASPENALMMQGKYE